MTTNLNRNFPMTDRNETRIRLPGKWQNKTSDGETYFSGSRGDGKLLILKNKYAEKESDPKWRLYLVPGKKPDAAKAAEPAEDES
jgi:hypothetical protein